MIRYRSLNWRMSGTSLLSREWRLDRQFRPLHDGNYVRALKGRELLLCQSGDSLNFVDPATSQAVRSFVCEEDGILAFTGSNSCVVAACQSGFLRVWEGLDAEDGKVVERRFKLPCKSVVRTLEFLEEERLEEERPRYVAAGTADGSVYVCDLVAQSTRNFFPGESTGPVNCLLFHPNRKFLLFAAYENGDVKVWDLLRNGCVAVLSSHSSGVTCLDFVPTDELGGLLSAARNGRICVWSLADLDRLVTEKIRAKGVAVDQLIAVGQQSATAGELKLEKNLSPAAASPQKRAAAQDRSSTPSQVKLVNLWKDGVSPVSSIVPIVTLASSQAVFSVKCLPTKRTELRLPSGATLRSVCPWVVLTADESGILKFWDPSQQEVLHQLETPHRFVGGILQLELQQLRKDAPWRLLTVGEDCSVIWWSCTDFQQTRLLLGKPLELINVQFCPVAPEHLPSVEELVGETFIKGGRPSKKKKNKLKDDEEAELDLTLTTMERLLLLRSDNAATLMETLPGRTDCVQLRGHSDIVVGCDATADGCWVATASKDRTARVFNTRLNRCVARLEGHEAPVVDVCISRSQPKGVTCTCTAGSSDRDLQIVTACTEGFLKVWQLRQARQLLDSSEERLLAAPLASVLAHEGCGITAIDVAGGDNAVATASADKLAKIYALPSLELLAVCRGHRRPVWAVKFSPKDKILATGSADATVKLFSMKDGACLKTLQAHAAPVVAIAWLPGGLQLFSATANGQLHLWDNSSSECLAVLPAEHEGKIWSVALDRRGSRLASCGVDDRVCLWQDFTAVVNEEQLKEKRAEDAAGQTIENLRRDGKVLEALRMTLELGRMRTARDLINGALEVSFLESVEKVTGKDVAVAKGAAGVLAEWRKNNATRAITKDEFQVWLGTLDEAELAKLLEFIVKWNTNAQTASLANSLLAVVLKTLRSDTLVHLAGLPTIARNFRSYAARHEVRLHALLQRSYLLDFALSSSGGAAPLAEQDLLVERQRRRRSSPPPSQALSREAALAAIFD